MMKNALKYILILFFALSINITCLKLMANGTKIFRVGAFNYYPAIFQDNDGIVKGFYVDALKEIEKNEDIRFEYIYGSWSEGIDRIKSGNIDVMPSVAYTPERALFLDYCKTPLLTVWGELYVTFESEIDNIKEVQGKTVAIMKGDFNAQYFIDLVKKFGIECNFVEMSGFDEVFTAVKEKKVDAGIVNSTFGVAKQKEFRIRSTGVVFNPFDIFFAVKKGENKELAEILDKYLNKWRHQEFSVYNQARQKWSHGTVGKIEIFPQWLSYFLAAIGFLILAAFVFIVLLRKQVFRATKDLLKQKEILRESEAKFKSYVNTAPDGIFVVNETGKYIEVNPAASIITGYAETELLALSVRDLQPPETMEQDMQYFIALKEQGRMSAEFEFVHKNNSKRWWSVEGIKLSEFRYLGFAKDITERKQAEFLLKEQNAQIASQNERYKQLNSELQKSKEKAEESDRLKTAFLQNMSHEIRTPLNAIMGFAELLPRCYDNKEKLEKFSRIINERGTDLIEIINGILDISKIESGQLTLNLEEIRIEKLLHEIDTFFGEFQKKIRKHNLAFNIVLDSKVANTIAYSDPVKLKQILINLIGNAFKYTQTGNIEVGCSLKNENDLLFYVKDTGIGIPANRHTEIFERFIQAHQNSNQLYGGNGLGLSIVKGLLDLLEGKIWLESEVGKGSTFFFTLPLKTK